MRIHKFATFSGKSSLKAFRLTRVFDLLFFFNINSWQFKFPVPMLTPSMFIR